MKSELTILRLKELLYYNSETGIFTWKINRRGAVRAGQMAGNLHPDGYVNIKIDGVIYGAHRLAWLYQTGNWPIDQVDHRNGIRNANQFINLRNVPAVINMQNVRRVRTNKVSSQLIGAVWCKRSQKWMSQLQMNGSRKHLGYFDSDLAAHAAYLAAKRALHPGNTL